MNMLEKQIAVKQHCLDNLTKIEPYAGYPDFRYFGDESTIPNGPWDTESNLPTFLETKSLNQRNIPTDYHGRPIHPWFKEMVHAIGVVAGRGKYWNWGPNFTVDPIVITDDDSPSILLVERIDTETWAFPGGFLDFDSESTFSASRRECLEETGVRIDEPISSIYIGPVADSRTTAHAWAFTNAKLWRLNNRQTITPQLDEVKSVDWFPIDALPNNMHGSHAKILEFALREL